MKAQLELNKLGYFETRGLNVLVFNNLYDGHFSDAKISGIELIHHDERTVTNGDVRLSPTPGQWDSIPRLIERKVHTADLCIEAVLVYPEYNFKYTLKAEAQDTGILLSVHLEKPLPRELEASAGFNLEFLPSAYFRKSYLMDNRSGIFPLYPGGPMSVSADGKPIPQPLAAGSSIVLAPEDPLRRITVRTTGNTLQLFDGRNLAQNGWYVLRTPLPRHKTGKVVEWLLTAHTVSQWSRQPVIAHSQIGYHPHQKKTAVIELDRNDQPLEIAHLLQITYEGALVQKYTAKTEEWGEYLRYHYITFDFSPVTESGLYVIAYGDVHTRPFRIEANIYEEAWHPTLDIFFPVQMDHMFVREAYRVWHGTSHLDDALQAPVNHQHFDLYAQGPITDTQYKPGAHIQGLNIGGWFDAGDFDIRTQTQYITVLTLVHAWETFNLKRDETTIDEQRRYVEIHAPDGIPDILQQIEHGTLALIAQFRAVGHAICGIVEPDLKQYTHLGDAAVKTDNLIYNPWLKPGESDGYTSGTFDDRWAFTSKSTPLNYGAIAALAAASRVLRGYRNELAAECLSTARQVWEEEHQHAPHLFQYGNTTGGDLEEEEFRAAVELLITTREACYALRIEELQPAIENKFHNNAIAAVYAIPYMPAGYSEKIKAQVKLYRAKLEDYCRKNPFGVPIIPGGWGGNGKLLDFAVTNYHLHKAFPELIDSEFVFNVLHYIYGCHPGSDLSFVSGVGTYSTEIAYGNNRADFSFIAGGIVPGVLILNQDFPEHKVDWPFLWGQKEYVVSLGASYIFLVNAVNELLIKT